MIKEFMIGIVLGFLFFVITYNDNDINSDDEYEEY